MLQLVLADPSFTFKLCGKYMGEKMFAQSSQRYLAHCFSKVLLSTSVIAQIYHTYSRLIWICSFLCSFCSRQKSGRRTVLKYYIFGLFEVC